MFSDPNRFLMTGVAPDVQSFFQLPVFTSMLFTFLKASLPISMSSLSTHAVYGSVSEHGRSAYSGLSGNVDVVGGDVVVTEHTP